MLPGPRRHESTKKRSDWFSSCLGVFVVAFAVATVVPVGASDVPAPDLHVTPIERDGQVLVSFDLNDGFTPDVRDAIQSGLSTTFSYEVELRRGSTLFDRTVAAVSIIATVHFDNLTRRYQMSRTLDGRLEDARPTDDQDSVRGWMTHFERVPLSTTSALEANVEYYVRVRAKTRPQNTWFFWPWGRTALGLAKFTFIQ
jgi:Domain of unknown function (DUF4390)